MTNILRYFFRKFGVNIYLKMTALAGDTDITHGFPLLQRLLYRRGQYLVHRCAFLFGNLVGILPASSLVEADLLVTLDIRTIAGVIANYYLHTAFT